MTIEYNLCDLFEKVNKILKKARHKIFCLNNDDTHFN